MELRFKFILLLLISSFIISGCKKYSSIEGFDSELWKLDKNGCNNTRMKYISVIRNNEDQIIGLTTNQITNTFGKPDLVELYVRNQKYFVYYLQPSKRCITAEGKYDQSAILKFRFEALGRVTEVVYEKL